MGQYSVNVVGESHYQRAIAGLHEGAAVTLRPEPGNPFDPRAVQVVSEAGAPIGYLPRDGWLTRVLIDEGGMVAARVALIVGGGEGAMLGVVLTVYTAADVAEAPPPRVPGLFERAGQAAREAAAKSAAEKGAAKRPPGCLNLGLRLIAVIVILSFIFPGGSKTPAPAAPAPEPKLAAAAIKDCEAALAKGARLGLIRDRPAANRIDVDEGLWAQLPYKTKGQVMQMLSCSAFGLYRPPGDQWVTAYGWRDGARKLQFTHDGVF